ncbi:hypothetical protein A3A46_04570 [Candidatus Roizmanbacteria bacterium RIFCSPLOWO2_01_FULL_37_13]|uniref:Uncharacterized protein n=1 Tax=Candidatus Roizmanbacteria bacterium RIFCSPHIGHO2_02_FULL_38_11 TaxID=1802039 RepID=A0A1F7H2I3_9BACT|nr:MAG: hypothetical protein A3C25_02535 [Candidatus Roizmanbacteria bacterium RIFCSPHIGHO2_02_FULL_38_11]OGK42996.1 MAG: hypothetical protein A3A46_04570 [Candidatus Roizmanbacteria bacterium RIFCSPLOWO2_01_FULL_37_13]
MLEGSSSGSDINTVLRAYRDTRYLNEKTASLAAQIAIANVMKAFEGILSRGQVSKAIGQANTPNAVSIAVRSCLPRI